MIKRALMLTAGTALCAFASITAAQSVPIIQPGAPGTAVKVISPAEAARIASTDLYSGSARTYFP